MPRIELIQARKRVLLRAQGRFRMGRRDDREVPSEGVLDELVEVVGVIMREQDHVDTRQLVQVHGWVCLAFAVDSRA